MRELRRMAGLRQKEVAVELGVSAETVCRWEAGGGRKNPIGRMVGEAFERLVNDVERVHLIRSSRRKVRREGRRLVEILGGMGEVHE